jgi:hypothetical protein
MLNQAAPVGASAKLTIFACAASAGIHAGIVPEHLREEPRLGVAFAIAVVVLLISAAIVALAPDRVSARAAALVLGGLTVAYVASRTTGIPLLAPDPEAVDGVGIAAVVVELLGMCCALRLAYPTGRRTRRPRVQEASQ